MKEKRKVLILAVILIIIFTFLSILLFNNKNLIITKLEEVKEKLTTEDGVISTSEHLEQMSTIEEQAYEKGKEEGLIEGKSQGKFAFTGEATISNNAQTGTKSGYVTLNCTNINNYSDLTLKDFFIFIANASCTGTALSSSYSGTQSLTSLKATEYDASKGILTVSYTITYSGSSRATANIVLNVQGVCIGK